MVLYFHFIKYLMTLFLVASILAIPSMAFFIAGYQEISSVGGAQDESIKGWLSVISMSNLGQLNYACNFDSIKENSTSVDRTNLTFDVFCSYGVFFELQDFGLEVTDSATSNCDSAETINLNQACDMNSDVFDSDTKTKIYDDFLD